ncbi:recombination mediator RecR [Algimonas porphyrae]|uniref:Recombination protein RecR n=1 Tax=Algimonas porphyrae TaxID=1128113 RepID=A0ABQ5V019_9PROT|nr:recombination mediator RecR [Algimonas porphyrae]GLQ19971.1 recombination protein RecR [Algimonas porphyrae]
MAGPSVSPEIDRLITLLARLPGLGPRSARRAALHLLKAPDRLMTPLAAAMTQAAERISTCSVCANVDSSNPCHICTAPGRDRRSICVVQDVSDLWAMERAGAYRGTYHVLGGTLSALDGIRPEDLNIASLIGRASGGAVDEVILAMNATVDGQTTAHYITEHLEATGVTVSRLAHGVPIGGELDYLDDGTINAAMKSRREL